jgi:hypothetical protein
MWTVFQITTAFDNKLKQLVLFMISLGPVHTTGAVAPGASFFEFKE